MATENPIPVESNKSSKPTMTLAERKKVPPTFYLSVFTILNLQYFGGMYTMEMPKSWWSSMTTSAYTCREIMVYLRDLCQTAFRGEVTDWKELAYVGIACALVGCILYVLVGAPLRAGLWTGRKATRHKLHRYMGLLFLMQYGAAWVEYTTNYLDGGLTSYLPHMIAMNGMFWLKESHQ
jgi:hypothetical protein